MPRRPAWSWKDFDRAAARRNAAAVPAAAPAGPGAEMAVNHAPPSPQFVRGQELRAMGVDRDLVLRCVRLTEDEKAALA